MRTSLVLAAVAASFISTAAFAVTATETIKAIDQSKHQLTTADGKVFVLPVAWSGAGFKAGDKVTVTYEMQGNTMTASAVAHAS